MRRFVGLVLVAAVSACQLQLAETPSSLREATEVKRKARPSARATAEPTATPGAIATPAPAPTPTATPPPSVPTMLLKGLVRIDASYVVSAGGGRIVSNNAGSLIEAAAGSLISNNGGGLISDKGMGLISNNGGGYRLLDAPAPGTMLPVKGMMVAPLSLTTGAQLGPAVYTDEAGAYAVAVPETQKDNVLLVAAIPGKDAQDPILRDTRLQYSLITAPKAAESRAIDEDTAIVTQYLRRCFVERLHEILTSPDARVETILIGNWNAPELLKGMMLALMKELRAEAEKIGIDAMPESRQRALTQRLTDVALSKLDLEGVRMDGQYYPAYTGPMDLAVPAMVEFFRAVREAAAVRLTADAAFFDAQPYMATANAGRETPYRILKPSDLGDFMVAEYMAKNDPQVYTYIGTVLLSLDLLMAPDGSYKRTERLRCAADTIIFKIGEAMLMNTNGTKDRLLEAISEFGQP